jgi:glycosyltransferase involved in cell wall biosynthesis
MKLPISVMIVGYNEEKFLPGCFESVSFCDEIVYTDLGSTDNSVAVARHYASQIYHREKVPSCEMIQTEVVHYLKYDWVAFIDPDEKVDASLEKEIRNHFAEFVHDKKLGAVIVPWQFYFKRHKLEGTVWGGMNQKYFLVHKNRFHFDPVVHYGRKLKEGFAEYKVPPDTAKNNVLHHYWMESFQVFLQKHLRYLKTEGIDRYNIGKRTGWSKVVRAPFTEFYKSFYTLRGYKDGVVGFTLSVFWAFYQTTALLSLFINQLKNKGKLANA